METSLPSSAVRRRAWGGQPAAFTLIEMMVVVAIIGMLLALLFPAVQAARESGRNATCQSNLRQCGIGLSAYAQKFGTYCSGAFDWQRDGAVTEVGWVADLVKMGMPVGKMLCPTNPAQISATYNDLLALDTSTFDSCVNRLGSTGQMSLGGSLTVNPCRLIASTPLAPLDPNRIQLVQNQILAAFYNTNYTASWWLVRSGVVLDTNGNLVSTLQNCPASLGARASTLGPLSRGVADGSSAPLSCLPLLACGGPSAPGQTTAPLVAAIGPLSAGAPTAASFTGGPVTNPTMQPLANFAQGTPQTGPNGWWAGWSTTIQDFRAFAPVHRGSCNILMADGSVQSYYDNNGDKLLNNGFTSAPQNGFADNTVELPPQEVNSGWTLRQ